jgi:hypothetical protein
LWVGPSGEPEEAAYRRPATVVGGVEGDAAIGSTTSARDPPAGSS